MYQIITDNQGEAVVIYVPGYNKEDIEVERTRDHVVVKGSTESPYALESSFCYKFILTQSAKVDPELINGVLVLHIKATV